MSTPCRDGIDAHDRGSLPPAGHALPEPSPRERSSRERHLPLFRNRFQEPGHPGNVSGAVYKIAATVIGAGAGALERAVKTYLAAGRAAPAHVVNLGHGVPPGADPAVLTGVVARVHGSTAWARTAAEPWEPDA